MLINEKTKIAALLKHHPDALEAIVSIAPDFKKLRNPILRKLMAGRTSISMASKVGGCSPEDFFKVLAPLGFEVDDSAVLVEDKVDNTPLPEYLTSLDKSQIKEFIKLYAKIAKKLKTENSIELNSVKTNIKETYSKEVYLTLIDEAERFVKFNVSQGSKEYVIPIFTDITEYSEGKQKISALFLDKLSCKVLSAGDIGKLADDDENFKGLVINPHSQNFMMDRNGGF